MKLLIFLDPLTARRNPVGSEIMIRIALEGAAAAKGKDQFESAVCAPGSDGHGHREHGDTQNRLASVIFEEENEYLAQVEPLFSGDLEAGRAQSAYYRGEGPAFEALTHLLQRLRSSVMDYDAVLSCQSGMTFDKAAAALGVQSARIEVWPNHGRRWRYYAFVRCRNPEGVDPLEGLKLSDLRDLDLLEVPASVDQRLNGGQDHVNPYECKFGPLDKSVQAAFRPDRKTALVVLQGKGRGSHISEGLFSGPAEFLERVVPPLLEAGWHCLLMGEETGAGELASPWADRPGVFLIDPACEIEMKEERRKVLALLSQSDLVVTDASHAALEAMILERPACVLGRPFYALHGLFPHLETVIEGNLDLNRYKASASLFRAFLFRAYATAYFGWASPRKILERARVQLFLNRELADQPRAWAREIFNQFGETESASWFETMRERHESSERGME